MNAPKSFGRTAASGAAYVGLAQAVSVFVSIVTTVIVARLLSPGDYGVLAMVAPIMTFLLMFRHLGLNHAAIQAKTVTSEQSNSLFWINMTASLAIALALLALAPGVAWFYGDPRPGYVAAASAANVLIGGSVLQHMALLNRELRFRRLSAIDIGSSLVQLVATVALAWHLRSYWALWLGSFVAMIFSNMLAWRSSGWRPSRPSYKGVGHMVRFGGAVTGFNLLNFFIRNFDNIVIGRVLGPGPLGLYDRSYRLMMFPLQNINGPLSRVVLPVLSRLQDEPERYRQSFLLTLRAIMLATMPGIAVASATSDRLIPFLLGPRWIEAVPIFFWLSLAALIQPVGNATGWLFITSGRGRALLRWGSVSAVALIAAFLTGVQWGAAGVAAAYFIVIASLLPLLFAWSTRGTSVSAADLYRVCLPPFLAAGLVWVAVAWAGTHLPFLPLIALALPLSYATAFLFLWLAPDGRAAVRTLVPLALSAMPDWLKRRLPRGKGRS